MSRPSDRSHQANREAIAANRKRLGADCRSALLVLLASLISFAPAAFAQSDSVPPELLDFTLAPSAVDAEAADAAMEWCATLRDDLSGLRRVVVFLPETLGPLAARDEIRFGEAALEETACGTLVLSRGTPQGVYDVQLFVEDQAGNAADYVAGDAFGQSRKKPPSENGGVRLLCSRGPCRVTNRP